MASRAEQNVVYAAGVVQGIDGVGLSTILTVAAIVAVCMGAWSFAVARGRPSPVSLHSTIPASPA